MKLKNILNESQDLDYRRLNVGEEKEEKGMTNEEKREFLKAVSEYKRFGESIYRSGNLAEVYESIKNIVETAQKVTLEETGDWFDKVTVNRHMKSMNESFKVFSNTIKEVNTLQQRLEACYDEMGEVLGKYYEIKEGNEFGAARAKAIAAGEDSFEVDGKEFPVTDVDKEDKENAKDFAKESVNESASRTAMEIGGLTGMNKDAIQKFVDDNNLDIEKVYQFVKKGKLSDRMDLVTAIAGKPNNPLQKKMISMFGESVNEDTKKRFDVDFYKGNGDRQTSHEEIIRGDKFSDVVSQATKVAKSKGMNYVEFYYKDAFIGSIDRRNGYEFKKGRNSEKSPLSVTEGKKRFRQQNGIGKSKYTISYHDGVKKHKDGSDFFDIQIFKNQKDVDAFRNALLQKGFVEESVNEADDFAGWIAFFNGKRVEIKKGEAKDLWGAKKLAIAKLKVPKSKESLVAIKPAYNESVSEGNSMKLTDLLNEDKYTVLNPKTGNAMGQGMKDQAAKLAKKMGGEKAGYYVIPVKNALKARRALEKFKFDAKNPKLKDIMSDLYWEVVEGKEVTLSEGYSTEEKRIVLMAVKKIMKYMNVDIKTAMVYVLGAGAELEREIQSGKVK